MATLFHRGSINRAITECTADIIKKETKIAYLDEEIKDLEEDKRVLEKDSGLSLRTLFFACDGETKLFSEELKRISKQVQQKLEQKFEKELKKEPQERRQLIIQKRLENIRKKPFSLDVQQANQKIRNAVLYKWLCEVSKSVFLTIRM